MNDWPESILLTQVYLNQVIKLFDKANMEIKTECQSLYWHSSTVGQTITSLKYW